jgi:TonB-linked SusC/RagA family outer membrane protein
MIKSKPIRNALLFIMRVAVIPTLITCISVMLAHALDSNGQDVLDRKITLTVTGETIKDVLAKIEKQVGVKFTYRTRLIEANRKVEFNASDTRLKDVLENMLGAAVHLTVIGKQVILKPAPKPVEFLTANAKKTILQFPVSGRVVDEAGAAIPGVNVIIKGTAQGTTTDADGKFTLALADSSAVLVFTFIGFATQEVPIQNRSVINITLKPDVVSLQEIVVVGYGEQKKATVTGAVATVKNDEIMQAPVTNLSNALVGRLPGVTFVNRSGEPGNDGSQIRIRGTNTIGNTGALIVIDGIANRSGGLERLNPTDIESITVLKDASAAIYGAQAANGVILVTTKRGKSGKPELGFNYNLGFNKPTRLPEVGDAPTYATMLNEIDEYRGVKLRYSAADIQKFRDGSDPWKYPNTDWYGAVIKPTTMQDMANVSLSGGTNDGVKYYVSFGKLSEDGFYKHSATKYNQYNFRSNVDAKITKFFNLSVDLSGRQENRNYPTRSAASIFRMLIRGKPTLPAYWPNGMPGPDIENGDNPVVTSTTATGKVTDNNYVFQSNIRGKIDVPWVNGLNVIFNAAFDESFRTIKNFATPWNLYTWDYASYDANGQPVLVKSPRGLSAPQLTEDLWRTSGRTSNAYINYTKNIGNHGIGLMVGTEKQKIVGTNFYAFRNAYISSAVDQLFAGGDNLSKTNGNRFDPNNQDNNLLYTRARLNYFGRINYSFSEKYLLEMVWRYDASYIFPASKRWGFFPGFSAGWVISEESFMKGLAGIDRLKIRGSWGLLGNDRINPFQFMPSFGFGGNYIFNYTTLTTSITPQGVPNPNVTWEVANNRNIGLEGTILGGKVTFEFDYFSNIRSQMLTPRNASIPRTAGFTPPSENIGKLRNRGFDYLVNYNGKSGQVRFQIGINGGYARNKILFWDEPSGFDPWQTSTGRPYGSNLYYDAMGVFKDQAAVDAYPHWPGARPGDIIFRDVNGDGVIDGKDRIRVTENTTPRFTGGVNLGAQFKGFDIAILFQGATGARSYIRTQSGDFGNYLKDFIDGRWTTENPSSSKPRTFNREDEYWVSQANTFWYRKTDYIRLKNVMIGYTFPAALVKKVGLKTARIYVNGVNLVTLDKFKVFDPETDNQDGTVYPQKKVYNMGVNLTF